ncbi:hypothetical protein GCM10025864_06350 [Luteimicrobium album]|uniref:HTH lacI-type domain-containing protein n=1 Tax=Luteimicrobium album TaxID=1054550 RepID=A0ABQ6HXX3_9MICO|nr:hypothetical protein GCM10025864_06350 [Luteimicrobium album]
MVEPSPGPGRRASVKDVAAAAGVSLGTVSNVLNRPERVSATTRDRVERAMADLEFVRNESARTLRAGHSSTLAYVMLDAGNPFFTDVAQGIEQVAEAAGLSLFLCTSDNRPTREVAHLQHLQQHQAQGVLVTPVDPDSPALDEVVGRGTPSSSSTAPAPPTTCAPCPSTTSSADGSPSSTSWTSGTRGSPSRAGP